MHILIVEDDPTQQVILKQVLGKYELSIAGSGEEGVELSSATEHDLIILDINLPGIDGYETCRQLREAENTRKTPIIFLSSYTSLDDRLEAYGSGGNDYITKPFDLLELKAKIDLYSNAITQHQTLSHEVASSHSLLMEVQTSASKLQTINRFVQATLFCHDVDMLFAHFFKAAKELDLGCVWQIHTAGGTDTRSSDGGISKLEQEILDMSGNLSRIHSFGKDRAIYRWGRATLLTRKVGDMIDTLAIFMDALEAGVKAVDTESKLLQKVSQLEQENDELRKRISSRFKQMNEGLQNAIISLGMVVSLDIEEEDKLSELIEGYAKEIDKELNGLKQNNTAISELVSELRTPPEELKELMNIDENEDDGGILLF